MLEVLSLLIERAPKSPRRSCSWRYADTSLSFQPAKISSVLCCCYRNRCWNHHDLVVLEVACVIRLNEVQHIKQRLTSRISNSVLRRKTSISLFSNFRLGHSVSLKALVSMPRKCEDDDVINEAIERSDRRQNFQSDCSVHQQRPSQLCWADSLCSLFWFTCVVRTFLRRQRGISRGAAISWAFFSVVADVSTDKFASRESSWSWNERWVYYAWQEPLKEVTSIVISTVKIELYWISGRIYEASLTAASQTHVLNAAENDDLYNSLDVVAVI